MIKAWFDGYCAGTKGGIGAVIRHGVTTHTIKACIGEATNNIAEYEAVRSVLRYLKAHNLNNNNIIVYGDSRLVIEQLSGKWNVRSGAYKQTAIEARKELAGFTNIAFRWIPREQNEEADELSKQSGKQSPPCKTGSFHEGNMAGKETTDCLVWVNSVGFS